MIKDKIFECFDEYVEKRHDEFGNEYTEPSLYEIRDSADDLFIMYYNVIEGITQDSDIAEDQAGKFEQAMYENYMQERHTEKVREIRENISDRRERYRTEQSLRAGKK